MAIDIVGDLDKRWSHELVRVCEMISALPNRDEAARATISGLGHDLLVRVTLHDGRSASRVVRAPEVLVPTLEALLSVPQPPGDLPASRLTHDREVIADGESPERATRAPAGDRLAVELGAILGTRLSFPGTGTALSAALSTQLRLRSWLIGMGLRGDLLVARAAAAPRGFEMDTVAISLSVARRLPVSVGQVDLGVSPRVVVDTEGADLAPGELNASSTDVRVAGFGRIGWGQGSIRLLVEVELELSPGHLRREVRVDPMFPGLPVWTAGLGVGISWAEP